MTKQIKITIDPVGRPTIEAIGYNGQGCEAATRNLELGLGGGVVADREFKPEYTNTEDQQEQKLGW